MVLKLEVIAFNISCCKQIAHAGAHRIELCANPLEGGTTPSHGFIRAARQAVDIDLFPIIRPRGGDFLYSEDEFDVIVEDVLFCKQAGCEGVVIGMLLPGGQIDIDKTARIVEIAWPMQVTFHRAFDRTRDPFEALEDLIQVGCTRILTSGQQALAENGSALIRKLILQSNGRITIMPGSGIRSNNVESIANLTGAVEFHSSARKSIPSYMHYTNVHIDKVQEHTIVDAEEVHKMQAVLQRLNGVAPREAK